MRAKRNEIFYFAIRETINQVTQDSLNHILLD